MVAGAFIKIIPKVDPKDGQKMEQDLNARFKRVADKFGSALKNGISKARGAIVFLGKGIASMIAGIIGSVMGNTATIDELNSKIDSTLSKADNVATRAGQIGTTSGKLIQVQAVAESAGVKNFDMVISRFQTELERSRKGETTYLKEFTGEKDTLDAFLKVMNNIRQLDKPEQNLWISRIFGERQNVNLSEFMQADWGDRRKQIFGNISEKQLTQSVDRLGEKEDLQSILRQRNEVLNLIERSNAITQQTIRLQTDLERIREVSATKDLNQYETMAQTAIAAEDAKQILKDMRDEFQPMLKDMLDKMVEIRNDIKNFSIKSWWKGIFN